MGEAKVSMGYTWHDITIRTKELLNKLALNLNIDPVEAYQLLVEYIENNSYSNQPIIYFLVIIKFLINPLISILFFLNHSSSKS